MLVYGSGKQTRTYCYISDAINGILRIMKYGKQLNIVLIMKYLILGMSVIKKQINY